MRAISIGDERYMSPILIEFDMQTDFTPTGQGAVEGVLFRGGTSKGLFVHREALPPEGNLRNDLVLELFGSPDPLQVDGIGGSKSHTSKLMIVDRSDRDGVDVEYTFGQVAVEDPVVDWGGNCGNLTSAIGAFAVLVSLVEFEPPAAELTLYNTNTDTLIDQRVPITADGPDVYGDYAIDGVPGTGSRIDSRFRDPAGGVTGSLFPTGGQVDRVEVDGEKVEYSIADVGNPCVFLRADDLGLAGVELPDELAENEGLVNRIELIRGAVCEELDLADNAETAREQSPAVPQIAVVSEPQSYDCSVDKRIESSEIDITARIFTSGTPHHAYAVTGAMCLAAACRLPGTVPNEIVRDGTDSSVTIGHPKGSIEIGVETDEDRTHINAVTVGRTVRPLFTGSVHYRYVGNLANLAPDPPE